MCKKHAPTFARGWPAQEMMRCFPAQPVSPFVDSLPRKLEGLQGGLAFPGEHNWFPSLQKHDQRSTQNL